MPAEPDLRTHYVIPNAFIAAVIGSEKNPGSTRFTMPPETSRKLRLFSSGTSAFRPPLSIATCKGSARDRAGLISAVDGEVLEESRAQSVLPASEATSHCSAGCRCRRVAPRAGQRLPDQTQRLGAISHAAGIGPRREARLTPVDLVLTKLLTKTAGEGGTCRMLGKGLGWRYDRGSYQGGDHRTAGERASFS